MLTCNLCYKEDNALVDSHIIPQSIHYLSTQSDAPNSAKLINSGGLVHPRRSPKGVYDQFVCTNCESIFGDWDKYAAEFFKQIYDLNFEQSDKYIELKKYDYKRLKLFFISLLWRADASKGQPMFRMVNVGEQHRTRLSQMIKNAVPGSWQEYAIFMERYNSKRPAASIIRSPKRAKMPIDGTRFYIFYLAGFKVYIKCDKRIVPSSQSQYYLKEEQKLLIPLIVLEESEEHWENVASVELERNKNAFW